MLLPFSAHCAMTREPGDSLPRPAERTHRAQTHTTHHLCLSQCPKCPGMCHRASTSEQAGPAGDVDKVKACSGQEEPAAAWICTQHWEEKTETWCPPCSAGSEAKSVSNCGAQVHHAGADPCVPEPPLFTGQMSGIPNHSAGRRGSHQAWGPTKTGDK